MRRVIVIGGGLAGLSAAVHASAAGASVKLLESAPQAGGRCRSYYDAAFGGVIDNGNHLVLSSNRAVADYVALIGAEDHLAGPDRADIAFADIRTGARWVLRPNDGVFPWWIFAPSRRVPGTRAIDYLAFVTLMLAGADARVKDVIAAQGALWEKLIGPFLLATLNTKPEESSARLAGTVISETLVKGGCACSPRIAAPHLASAFIDPALAYLAARGAEVWLNERVRALQFDEHRLASIEIAHGSISLGANDVAILAVPPPVAQSLIPSLEAPDDFRAILNVHFRVRAPGAAPILGVIGGAAEWIFVFPGRVSVTVSAADALIDWPREELAALLWTDVAKLLEVPPELPPWQIVKEKRATFAATPKQEKKRPGAATRWPNLFLAGDWTNTGLPATIEGALRSGEKAVALSLSHAIG